MTPLIDVVTLMFGLDPLLEDVTVGAKISAIISTLPLSRTRPSLH